VTTQLWHHIFCGGGLCDLPEWSPPSMAEGNGHLAGQRGLPEGVAR
jgi:hypothetical protein